MCWITKRERSSHFFPKGCNQGRRRRGNSYVISGKAVQFSWSHIAVFERLEEIFSEKETLDGYLETADACTKANQNGTLAKNVNNI